MFQSLNFQRSQLNQSEIMSRVLFLYRLKRAFFSPWAHASAFGLLALAALSLVSIADVLTNLWQSGDSYHYVLSALSHTELLVQVTIAGLVLFLIVLAGDFFKNFKPSRSWRPI